MIVGRMKRKEEKRNIRGRNMRKGEKVRKME